MKYNKYLLITITALAVLSSIYSCSKDYLDSYPLNSLSSENYYTSEKDMESAINAAYRPFMDPKPGITFHAMQDIATPFSVGGDNRWTVCNFGSYDIQPTWVNLNPWWSSWYEIILNSNIVLEHIDSENIEISTSVRNRIKGEALFLRALSHFYLTMSWGDVPLIKERQEYDKVKVNRTPKAEVLAQVITDLTEASQLLPHVTEYRQNKALLGRASWGSAMGLLGKVYVYTKDYANAKTTLLEVINSGDYSLSSKFSDNFWPDTENNNESLFEIQAITGLQLGSVLNNYLGPNTSSGMTYRGFSFLNPTQYFVDQFETINGYSVNSTFVNKEKDAPTERYNYTYTSTDPEFNALKPFENRDPRLKWTVLYENSPYLEEFMERTGQTGINYRPGYSDDSNYNTVKYNVGKLESDKADNPQNVIILRYADILLLYAEANLETLDLSTAAEYINKVRKRPSVNMPNISSTLSQEELRQILRKERYTELAFEFGHIYFDQVRWGIFVDEMKNYWTGANNRDGHGGFDISSLMNDHFNVFPIPQTELDANPELVQNPGYN